MSQRPWTLRDLRRALAHAANRYAPALRRRGVDCRDDGMPVDHPQAWVTGTHDVPLHALDQQLRALGITTGDIQLVGIMGPPLRDVFRAVDRAIRRFGPDHIITQEGGDHDEPMMGPRHPIIETAGDVPASRGGVPELEEPEGVKDGSQAGPESGSDEETAGEETSPTATSPAHPPAADPDVDAEHSYDDASDCGMAETDRDASHHGGGVGDPRYDTGATSPSLADVRGVSAVVRAIARLADLARRAEPTPRWDGRRVVHELVSSQLRIHRMRQDAPALRAAMILYDVSGSCAWVADQTASIAAWVAARDPRILVAPTGDRYPEGQIVRDEIRGRSSVLRAIQRLAPERIADQADYRKLVRAGVSHMLALGDAHGHYGYRCAAEAGIDVRWVNPNPDIAPDDWHHGAYALCDERTVVDAIIAVCTTR